jgi:hypothetical protein
MSDTFLIATSFLEPSRWRKPDEPELFVHELYYDTGATRSARTIAVRLIEAPPVSAMATGPLGYPDACTGCVFRIYPDKSGYLAKKVTTNLLGWTGHSCGVEPSVFNAMEDLGYGCDHDHIFESTEAPPAVAIVTSWGDTISNPTDIWAAVKQACSNNSSASY